MLATLPERWNKRPKSKHDYEFRWSDVVTDKAEFQAIVDVAMNYIANPPNLFNTFKEFPHYEPNDNVMKGSRGALSQHVIYGLAKALGFESYLEVGTRYSYSIGAVLAASRKLKHAVTVDPFVDPACTFANLATLNSTNVKLEVAHEMSEDFKTTDLFDAVYVDGDHSYQAAYDDICHFWNYVKPGGLLMVDDTINNRGDALATRDLIGVYWAVRDFLNNTNDFSAAVMKLPTYSGFAIIQKIG